MIAPLNIDQRNAVLNTMAQLVHAEKTAILKANKKDIQAYDGKDVSMYDRLKLNESKIEGMVKSLRELAGQQDPLGVERYRFEHDNGMQVINKTAPFGTILIIYESRPDVTIEAAGIAFKSGNKILLKGGKESLSSNLALVALWHRALHKHQLPTEWVKYLKFNRTETQLFLEMPSEKVDLIVPRGGEKLIEFVKLHANCPVIVSGRGNNFIFVDKDADPVMALDIIINAKATKISACNALDKVLIAKDFPDKDVFFSKLVHELTLNKVEIWADAALAHHSDIHKIEDEAIWYEEFLDYKIALAEVGGLEEAIAWINRYSGGHSSAIISKNNAAANKFIELVDSAAVYHNASTRFTDGGQFGLGGELAISTDKLHQRGPIGLNHLTTNKWVILGKGQVRG